MVQRMKHHWQPQSRQSVRLHHPTIVYDVARRDRQSVGYLYIDLIIVSLNHIHIHINI